VPDGADAVVMIENTQAVDARTIEVVLRLVPDGLRESGLALGASRARVVWSVVLPTMGHSHGMVYVLPEDEPVRAMFADPQADTTVAARRVNVSTR